MTRRMNPRSFPTQYFEIALKVGGENKTSTLPLLTAKEGHQLRGHFYLFKGVIRQHYEENIAPKPLDARTEDDVYFERVQRCLEKTSIWIDKDKLEARFIHRDQGRYGQMLARATISDGAPLGESLLMQDLKSRLAAISRGEAVPDLQPPATTIEEEVKRNVAAYAPNLNPSDTNKPLSPDQMRALQQAGDGKPKG